MSHLFHGRRRNLLFVADRFALRTPAWHFGPYGYGALLPTDEVPSIDEGAEFPCPPKAM